jgi:hypothetical protein
MKRSELKNLIKEILIEESLDQGWPKSVKDQWNGRITNPGIITPKPLAKKYAKIADLIKGNFKPVKKGESYINAMIANGDYDSKTEVSTELTDWFENLENTEFVEKSSYGSDQSTKPVAVIDQTDYIILGEKFSVITTAIARNSYTKTFPQEKILMIEKDEVVTDSSKLEPKETPEMYAIVAHSNVHRRDPRTDFFTKHDTYYWMSNDNDGELLTKAEFIKAIKRVNDRKMERAYREYMGTSSDNFRIYTDVEKFKADCKKVGITPNI